MDATPLPVTPQDEEDVRIYKKLGRTSYASEGKDRSYKDRRLLAFYFDMTAMRPDDQVRAPTGGGKVCAHADDRGRLSIDPSISRWGR